MSNKIMKRLVYLHQYFAIPQKSGGTRSWEFSRRLLRDGWYLSIITSDVHLNDATASEFFDNVLKEDEYFSAEIMPSNYSNQKSYIRRMFAFASFTFFSIQKIFLNQRIDLVFATSTPLTIAIPALLRKWIGKTPFVFEVRDLWPELPMAMGALRSPLLVYFARRLELLAYQHSSHIIALSPGMKAGIIDCGIPEYKISIIPNSCDNKLFDVPNSVGEEFLHQNPKLSTGPLIVYVGTLGKINGVSYLAYLAEQFLSLLPEANFLVVGTGACEEEIKVLSQSLKIFENNFWLWKAIPKVEVPVILSAATVATSLFLPLPEMEHNSANKFFDALAAGCPLAINYKGWQKDILQESGAGIALPYHDIPAAALKLLSFVQDSNRLANARCAARTLADKEFSRDSAYQKLAMVLSNAMEKG